MTITTLSSRIKEQDAQASQLLLSLLERPGLYVGQKRFDYIDFLFGGFCLALQKGINFMPSNELQYWLLHAQSASLHGSLSGASLLYRCFGFNAIAFDNYKVFLDVPLPTECKEVNAELFAYEETYDLTRFDWEDDVPAEHNMDMAQSVYTNITTMLDKDCISYDAIKVYIHKERLFNHVRFLYHSNDGWSSDIQVIGNPEYHNHLLAIHANVRNATMVNLRNCGYDVFDTIAYDDSRLPSHDAFSDEITFSSEFNRWKEKIINA